MSLYYFGCADQPGHHLYDQHGRMLRVAGPFTPFNIDGIFPHRMPGQDESIVSLVYWQGWTVLAMWDRSIDTRQGSNVAFIADTPLSLADMWSLARATYPKIVARLKAAQTN